MPDAERDRISPPGTAATPPEEEGRFGKWSKQLSERVKQFAAIGALVVLGWNANNYWREELNTVKNEMTSKWAEDRKAFQELKEEHEKLRRYMERHEDDALYQFYRMCSERGGVIDYDKRSCTEPGRRTRRTFELLEPAKP